MNKAKTPRSLRSNAAVNSVSEKSEIHAGRKVTAVAGLMAVASFSGAEAQQSNLPPVTVDAPVTRPRPTVSKPTPDQIRARNALRRAARRSQPTQVAPVPFPNAGTLSADRNPYADAAAPYKVDHLQASGKFPEPLLNTPKTVTVISKEVLADENATSLKQAVLNTAGVTLGTGEGGNAFGDRFFVRGFDTRNDVFIDGVRDSGVSVRENFFTEQIEILRGPGSSFAGRGTTGGAINIVTKQATTEKSFYNMDETIDDRSGRARHARRQPGDQPDLCGSRRRRVPEVRRRRAQLHHRRSRRRFRRGDMEAARCREGHRGLCSHRHPRIAGFRRAVLPAGFADREPTPRLAHHTVHHNAGGPYPGFRRQRSQQFLRLRQSRLLRGPSGIATINTEVQVTPDLTLSDKTRASRSLLNYIGTIPESPITECPATGTFTANPQSRYQPTDVVDNQSEATYKFDTDGWHHTAVAGVEVSREISSIDKYVGLTSEGVGSGAFNGTGSATGASMFNPQYTFDPFGHANA